MHFRGRIQLTIDFAWGWGAGKDGGGDGAEWGMNCIVAHAFSNIHVEKLSI